MLFRSENSDARRMIPSWDEPAYKASFALQATIPAGELAVSNMPVTRTTPLPDGRVRVRTLTLPDSYQDHDTPDRMYAEAGLDRAHIVATILGALGRSEDAKRAAARPRG